MLLDLVARVQREPDARPRRAPSTRATTSKRSRSCGRPSRPVLAPSLAHVVLEVLPYLARAGVLEPLDGYDEARDVPVRPGARRSGARSRYRRASRLFGIPFNRSTPIAFYDARHLRRGAASRPRRPGTSSRRSRPSPHAKGVRRRDALGLRGPHLVVVLGRDGRAGRRSPRRADDGRIVARRRQPASGRFASGSGSSRRDRVMRPPPGRDYQAWQSTNESFLRGRIAMMWSSTAYVRYLEDNAPFPGGGRAAPAPAYAPACRPAERCSSSCASAPDEEKRAAWEFVRWMCERRADERVVDAHRVHAGDATAVDRLVDSAAGTPSTRTIASRTTSSRTSTRGRGRRSSSASSATSSSRASRRPFSRAATPTTCMREARDDAREARVKPRVRLAPVAHARADARAARRVLRRCPSASPPTRASSRGTCSTPPRYVGAANYRAARGARRAPARSRCARSATARSSSTGDDDLGLGARAPRRTARGAFFAFVRASIFSAYVVSWVAVALLWMWLLDGNAGVVGQRPARARRAAGVAPRRPALGAAHARVGRRRGSSPGTR